MRIASTDRQAGIATVVMAAHILVAAGGLACRGSRPKRDAVGDAESVAERKVGPPVDLAGTVQDSRGTPLPDALVIAWPKDKHPGSVVQARSNPDGRFVLPRLLPGTWTLLAEAAGFGTLELDRAVPDSESFVLALDGEGRSLSGLVLSSPTRAEPGAHVVLGGPGLRWLRETVADAHGVFSFAGLGLGRFVGSCHAWQAGVGDGKSGDRREHRAPGTGAFAAGAGRLRGGQRARRHGTNPAGGRSGCADHAIR